MDFDETMLKERFETAVGGVSPNVSALVNAGCELGGGMRRRRRAQGLGAAVASAAAVAVVAYVGIGQGLFDSDATGPADGPETVLQLPSEPSTPRSLAAVAMSHIDQEPFAVGSQRWEQPDGQVFATIGYQAAEGKAELYLVATPQVEDWGRQAICKSPGDAVTLACDTETFGDGSKMLTFVQQSRRSGSGDSYFVLVGVRRADHIVAVMETTTDVGISDIKAPLSQWALPVDVETLRVIVTDPRFGLTTDPESIKQGKAIKDFNESGLGESDSATERPGD